MNELHSIIAPVIADDQDRRIASCKDVEVVPTDFGCLFPDADYARGPVEHGRITALLGWAQVFIARCAELMTGISGFALVVKPSSPLFSREKYRHFWHGNQGYPQLDIDGSDIVNDWIEIDYIVDLISGVTGRIVEHVRLSAR